MTDLQMTMTLLLEHTDGDVDDAIATAEELAASPFATAYDRDLHARAAAGLRDFSMGLVVAQIRGA